MFSIPAKLKAFWAEIPINDPSVREFLKEMIQENLEAIGTERYLYKEAFF